MAKDQIRRRRLALSPQPALWIGRAWAKRDRRLARALAVLGAPFVVLGWYFRLAWHTGAGRVHLHDDKAVLAYSGIPISRSRRPVLAPLACLALAAITVAALTIAPVALVTVALRVAGHPFAAHTVTTVVAALISLLLLGYGLYCTSWDLHPHTRDDRLSIGYAGRQGWRIIALAGCGAGSAAAEAALLSDLLQQADRGGRTVVAGRVPPADRLVLQKQLDSVPPPLGWPSDQQGLLVHRPRPVNTATGRPAQAAGKDGWGRSWTFPLGLALVLLPLVGGVSGIAIALVLPAERADPACQSSAVTNCLRTAGDAAYWAVTTLTTTGYGDLVPHSGIGRFWGAITMLTGVLFLAAVVGGLILKEITDTAVHQQETRQFLETAAPIPPSTKPIDAARVSPVSTPADNPPVRPIASTTTAPAAAAVLRIHDLDADMLTVPALAAFLHDLHIVWTAAANPYTAARRQGSTLPPPSAGHHADRPRGTEPPPLNVIRLDVDPIVIDLAIEDSLTLAALAVPVRAI